MSDAAQLINVAFAACTALDSDGIVAVLTGGSAATFYAPERYQSYDTDFILQFDAKLSDVDRALSRIGFARTSSGHYESAQSNIVVEFPRGPLQIGEDFVTSWNTVRREAEVLYVLHPTDSVRDRFMAYYAWNDYSSFVVAVDVARAAGPSFDALAFESWARREAKIQPFAYDTRKIDEFFRSLAG